MTRPSFDQLFQQATLNESPLPYQYRLALADPFPTLVDVPTGLGKTAAAILAWVCARQFAVDAVRRQTPRRLVYCLPMRVLVEQTFNEAVRWLDRLGLLAGDAHWDERGVDTLPTKEARLSRSHPGAERGYWAAPEAAAVRGWAGTNGDRKRTPRRGSSASRWRRSIGLGTLAGTRRDPDRHTGHAPLRAMNRGYAAGRARWPLEFGFLNSDCLWVFDEIQIMDTGLASSLQLDAWRRSLRLRAARDQFPAEKADHLSRPCRSLWMSATMAKHWLERAVDWSPRVEDAWKSPQRVRLGQHELPDGQTVSDDASDRVKGLFDNKKLLVNAPVATLTARKGKDGKPDESGYLDELAPQILEHKATDGLTLVIVNTVDRAVGIFRRLIEKSKDTEIFLIHSRFRPMERERWTEFLNRKDGKPRVVVSTQVVEAGVDLSARVLFTELSPWASLVQRFGRCARYPGENGTVYWMDIVANERAMLPYTVEELNPAREQLAEMTDVGLRTLKRRRDELDARAATLFPYEPRFVPHDKDLFDLFDTTPDLTGADVDISRFIRDGEELDVQVFWREVSNGVPPHKEDRPHRRELCAVPFHRFRELLPALRKAGRIWRRTYRRGWEGIDARDSEQVYPGQVFMLERSCGGYDGDLGWTGVPMDRAFELPTPIEPPKATAQDDEDEADDLSQIKAWLTIEAHTRDVCQKLDELLPSSGLTELEAKALRLAARLHDWGKAHAAFQAKLWATAVAESEVQRKLNNEPVAKAPVSAWRNDKIRPQGTDTPESHSRPTTPGFPSRIGQRFGDSGSSLSRQARAPLVRVARWPQQS